MLSKITLPGTTLSVSQLCLGSNMFGTALDQAASSALLDGFAAAGGNFIDTARAYGDWIPAAPLGASERAIGAWLAGRDRGDYVIATKGGFMDLRAGNWLPRVTPAAIEQDLLESLGHLGVKSIDLYWLHADDTSQPVAPLIDALIAHQKAGRIRYFGASNWTPARIEAAQAYANSLGHAGFAAIQPFWGLATPNRDAAMLAGYGFYYEDGLQALHAAGLPMIPYAGQSRGYFAKRAAGGAALPDNLRAMYDNDTNTRRFAAAELAAARHSVSINDIAIAYLVNQPHVTVPIIGASTPAQLADTMRAASLRLSPAELATLGVE